MNFFSYLLDPAHWAGTQGIPVRLGQMFTDGFQRDIPAEIIAGIVLVLVIALVVDALLLLLGRALTPWDRSRRPVGRPA